MASNPLSELMRHLTEVTAADEAKVRRERRKEMLAEGLATLVVLSGVLLFVGALILIGFFIGRNW